VSNSNEISARTVGKPPLASVVIPAYNAALYIGATLDAVLKQSFSNFEVLVINDGSPDTTALEQALAPYQSKIRYIRQENAGPSGARNAGIRTAVGKYIAFLDSDDVWLPQHLEKQVGTLEANPQLQMVYSNGLLLRGSAPIGVIFENSPQSLPVDLDCLLHERSTVVTSSAVVLREALIRVGMFDEQLRRCEDYDLWLRLVQSGATLSFSRDIQIGHRQSNGLASDWELMRHALIKVYEKHLALGSLDGEQALFVQHKIKTILSTVELRNAKRALLDGDFPKALANVRSAQASAPSRKLGIIRIGLQGFPYGLQALYRLYVRWAQRKHRERSKRALQGAGLKVQLPDGNIRRDPTLL